MAYNGIGLTTPRGSGTNGYVQRNLSALRPRARDLKPQDFQKPPVERKPNKDIIEHNNRRQIELEVMLFREKLTDEGVSSADIKEKMEHMRAHLTAKLARGGTVSKNKVSETHAVTAAKEKENAKLRAAFGIGEGHEEGASFAQLDPEAKEEAKEKRKTTLVSKRYLDRVDSSDSEDTKRQRRKARGIEGSDDEDKSRKRKARDDDDATSRNPRDRPSRVDRRDNRDRDMGSGRRDLHKEDQRRNEADGFVGGRWKPRERSSSRGSRKRSKSPGDTRNPRRANRNKSNSPNKERNKGNSPDKKRTKSNSPGKRRTKSNSPDKKRSKQNSPGSAGPRDDKAKKPSKKKTASAKSSSSSSSGSSSDSSDSDS